MQENSLNYAEFWGRCKSSLTQYMKCNNNTNSTVLLGKRNAIFPCAKAFCKKKNNHVPVTRNIKLQIFLLSAAYPFTIYCFKIPYCMGPLKRRMAHLFPNKP